MSYIISLIILSLLYYFVRNTRLYETKWSGKIDDSKPPTKLTIARWLYLLVICCTLIPWINVVVDASMLILYLVVYSMPDKDKVWKIENCVIKWLSKKV